MKKTLSLLLTFICLASLRSQTVKAISFNIRYSAAASDDSIYAWPHRMDAVLKMIDSEKPEVMGLQEALLDQLTPIDNHLAKNYRRIGLGRDDGKEQGEFMAIYYNTDSLELLDYGTQWLSPTPHSVSRGWDAACMRTVTIAHFRHRSSLREFYYFNTHLDHVGKEAQRESVKMLADLMLREVPHGMAVILGGDMNTTMEEPVLKPLLDRGFLMARIEAPKSDKKHSYNAFGRDLPSTIDHFFVKYIHLLQFCTLDSNYGVPFISDHYPIEILFTL